MTIEEQKEVCLSMADKLFHYKWIAAAARMSDDKLKRLRDEDPEFADGLKEGRSRFIANNMRKARPDFLLETADRETFGKVEKPLVEVNVIDKLLIAYGIKDEQGNVIEGDDDKQINGDVSPTSKDDSRD